MRLPCVVARRHESEPTGAAALLPLTPFCVQPFLHLPGPPNFGMSAQFAQAPQSAWIAGAEVARGAFATQMVLQQCSIIISLREGVDKRAVHLEVALEVGKEVVVEREAESIGWVEYVTGLP